MDIFFSTHNICFGGELRKLIFNYLLSTQYPNIVQVDPTTLGSKDVELYKMLISLLEQEAKCVEVVRESEEEVREILNDRTREETAQELEISVYDTERNEKAKKHRRELVRVIVVSPMGQPMKNSTTT